MPKFEVVSGEMAEVLGQKTGAERLAIASRMFESARQMRVHHLGGEHPEWDAAQIEKEAARRLSHGAV